MRHVNSKWIIWASLVISLAALPQVIYGQTETVQRLRIVDWGQISGRMHEESNFTQTQTKTRSLVDIYDQDLDGNPKTTDRIQTSYFSLKKRLSPQVSHFDDTWVSSRFYGGCTFYYYNRPQKMGGGISEFYNNSCETVTEMQPSSDFAVHMANPKNREYRGYFVPVWLKEDFPHLGKDGRVSFDKTSLFILNQQRHWSGYDGVRFVVRNGDQFYLSEVAKDNWQYHYDIKSYCPVDVKWGKWNPKAGAHDFRFDPKTPMEKVKFDNVTAAGFYLFKDDPRPVQTGFKFEAFEVFATVTRSKLISERLDMKKVESTNLPPFYMTKTEVSYQQWKKTFRWSEAVGVFAHTIPGMIYDRNGDMGSMDEGFYPHHHDEPATDMTVRDMLAWCNALSEFECRQYVYYTDPSFKPGTEYRNVINDPWRKKALPKPDIYVKWDADGYRLPTASEWLAVFEGSEEQGWTKENAKGSTHAVGTKKANSKGFSDMKGNVWECVWNWDDCLKADQKDMLVLGDSFAGCGAGTVPRHPFNGSARIGLRVVRREKGLKKPTSDADLPEESVWKISGDLQISEAPNEQNDISMIPLLPVKMEIKDNTYKGHVEMPAFEMAKTETSYRQWRSVYDWALRNGYAFDRDGDMGSMYLRLYKNTHTPDEPVTMVTYYDMLTWCNALSEKEGRKPVFYEDKKCTKVYRQAWRHRPVQLRYKDLFDNPDIDLYIQHTKDRHPERSWVYMDWSADGYRLPTLMEWEVAYRSGKESGSPIKGKAEDYAWIYSNASMRTHGVASKPENSLGFHGMYGNVLELWMDSIAKGGGTEFKRHRRQTKHPIQHFVPYRFSARWRTCAKKTNILHDSLKKLEIGNPFGFHIAMFPAWGWPDTGFRVVRCKTGTYPRGGMAEDFVVSDFKPLDLNRKRPEPQSDKKYGYDPLQGQCYRGNLMRNGIHTTSGLKKLGGIKWKFKTGDKVRSSPVVYDGVCYVGSLDGNFYAIDAITGEQKWVVKTGGPVYSSACVYEGEVFFGSDDGYLYSANCKTGEVRWKIKQKWKQKNKVRSSPAIAYGTVFISGGTAGEFEDLQGQQAPTNGYDIETKQQVLSLEGGGSHFASPAIKDKLLAVMFRNGFITYDLKTGMQLVIKPLYSSSTCSYGSAVLVGDKVYSVITSSGAVAESNAKGIMMSRVWIDPKLDVRTMQSDIAKENKCYASPVIVEDTAYIGSGLGVFSALGNSRKGSTNAKSVRGWTLDVGSPIVSSASFADRVLYFGTADGTLYALPAAKLESPAPKPLWTFKTEGAIYSSPWPGDSVVYVSSDDGYVYCLEGPEK